MTRWASMIVVSASSVDVNCTLTGVAARHRPQQQLHTDVLQRVDTNEVGQFDFSGVPGESKPAWTTSLSQNVAAPSWLQNPQACSVVVPAYSSKQRLRDFSYEPPRSRAPLRYYYPVRSRSSTPRREYSSPTPRYMNALKSTYGTMPSAQPSVQPSVPPSVQPSLQPAAAAAAAQPTTQVWQTAAPAPFTKSLGPGSFHGGSQQTLAQYIKQVPTPGRFRNAVPSAMPTTLAPSGSSYLTSGKESVPTSLCSTVNRTNQASRAQPQAVPTIPGQSAHSLLGPAGRQPPDLVQTIQLTQADLQERMSKQQQQQVEQKEQELQLTKVSLEEKDRELAKRDKEILEKEGELCDLRRADRHDCLPSNPETKKELLMRPSSANCTAHDIRACQRVKNEQELNERRKKLRGKRQLEDATWPEKRKGSEEDVRAKEVAFWQAGADVFQLTFKTVRADTLFFPNSMIAEGRNYLFAAASYVELQMGYRYTYYCFFDADTALEDWHAGWRKFESFLREWEPAVGLPTLDAYSNILNSYRKDDRAMVRTVLNFDHTVEAVHSDAAKWLLPYVLDHDEGCQWVSQWRFASLANALFPEHVLLTHHVEIENTAHGNYNKDYCLELMMKATLELRERLPEAASCFVEPRNEAVMLNGALRLSAYLPWGRALRRGEAEPERRFYGGEAIMRELRSCEGQPAVQAMSQQASYSWCRGCPMSLTFGILQSIVVQRPYEFVGWLRLADFLAWTVVKRDDLLVSEICLSVAVRVVRCLSGIDGTRVSWEELRQFHAAHVAFGIHMEPNEETIQEIERLTLIPSRRDLVIIAVRLAVTPQGDEIEPVSLMAKDQAETFVDWLLHCPAAGGT
ncbi:unnamed protein product [Symbiodinium natans]|uniref:Uncharacterized protein n=1 Tax=Symbiodinium natans TaxID=878477 RepID=A0A812UHK0_9DINO|nr:unnamed protein product [Symbiodinium natans]